MTLRKIRFLAVGRQPMHVDSVRFQGTAAPADVRADFGEHPVTGRPGKHDEAGVRAVIRVEPASGSPASGGGEITW